MAEAHSEPSQTSKMKFFAKIATGFQLLTIFAKIFILDVWLGSEYASKYPFQFDNSCQSLIGVKAEIMELVF